MVQWILRFIDLHQNIFWALGIFSVLLFFLSAVAIPIVIARMPVEYLNTGWEATEWKKTDEKNKLKINAVMLIYHIIKNVTGLCLVTTGIILLFLPGQGLLTLLIGISLMDFPGKKRFVRSVMGKKSVLGMANRIRNRMGKPPLNGPDWMDSPDSC